MKFVKDAIRSVIQEILSTPSMQHKVADAVIPIIHEKALAYLSKGFDIHVRDVLRPKVGPKEEYVVYENVRPATLWFLLDMSDMREGDKFEIKLYIRLSDGEFLLRDYWELENQREMPMVTLSSQFAPSCRLTIAQVRGLSKEVRYEVFGRYEGR